jgi:hypothetical protein
MLLCPPDPAGVGSRIENNSRLLITSGAFHAQVERILEQRLRIGANIQRNGQRGGGVYAGEGSVERQFANGDTHTVRTEVAQPKNALTICHHDSLHCRVRDSIGLDDGGDATVHEVIYCDIDTAARD